MKKFLKVALVAMCACALAFAVAGCSKSEPAAPAEFDGNFVVGFDAGYPPYGYVAADGSYTGIDLELAAEVCARNDWTFTAEPIDWDAKDALIEQGNIVCIWNGFTYEGREDKYAWSTPYMLNAQVVVARADAGIASEADLAGQVVMTQVDSAALDVLEGEDMAELTGSFAELQTIDKYDNAFMQLEAGLVNAVACDLSVAAYQMAANPGMYVQVCELSSEHYAVGFKLGNEALAATVTETLKAMDADGFVEELCAKYAEDGVDYANWCL